MKTATEIRVQRMTTRAFIAADYIDIVLHTLIPGTGPDKGILIAGPDRVSQRFRLIPMNISPNAGQRYDTREESTATFLYTLMGDADVVIELYDWWENSETGQKLQITTVYPDNGYERKGAVNLFNRAK